MMLRYSRLLHKQSSGLLLACKLVLLMTIAAVSARADEAPVTRGGHAANSLESLEQLVTARADASTAIPATDGAVPVTEGAVPVTEGAVLPTRLGELVDEDGEDVAASESASLTDLDSWLDSLKGGSLRLMLLLGAVSLAPAAFLMTTSYVRIVVVLSLLKQALGNQQALPAQATTALALFMTGLIMTPVWQQVYSEAVQPYQAADGEMTAMEALQAGIQPVRQFMSRQIDHADNGEDVWLFYRYLPKEQQSNPPETYDDVPLQVLLPAFLLSELKTAFLIGFQIYLPFLVLDFVIATVITSMGLNTMQPGAVAFPFKLLLFVLVDGWRLVAGTLLESFGVF